MKSQFVKINALQGKGRQSEHSQLPIGWSGGDTQSTVPFDQLHAGKTPFGQTAHSPGKGLLSYWDAHNSRFPHPNGSSGRISVAEQNTFKQPAMVGPITDPARNVNHAQAQILAYGQVPLSPYQSGITPFAAMNPTSQTLQAPLSPSIQYPGMQQLSPISWYAATLTHQRIYPSISAINGSNTRINANELSGSGRIPPWICFTTT